MAGARQPYVTVIGRERLALSVLRKAPLERVGTRRIPYVGRASDICIHPATEPSFVSRSATDAVAIARGTAKPIEGVTTIRSKRLAPFPPSSTNASSPSSTNASSSTRDAERAGERAPPDAEVRRESRPKSSISRGRLIFVDALIVVTTVLAVVGMLSIWANRLLFNPDNWEKTSTQLLQNSDVRTATANYVVDQLYANVDVAGLVKSGLPPRLAPLAGPAAGALRNAAVRGVELALTSPEVQSQWATANRAADQTFIAIVNGGNGAVKVNGGVVTLDLASVVNDVASRLGLPAGLGSRLPASVASLTVFRSDQLRYVQDGGKAVRSLALWLTILVPLLYALAIFIARGHRRRTLMTAGFAFAFAGVIGVAGRSILESQITNSLVSEASLRPAVRAAVTIATGILGQIAGAFILLGLVAAAAAWFAGPTHPAVVARRAIAPFLRERTWETFAIVTVVMVVIFIWQPIPSTGTPVGITVYLLLALLGTEVLRRQTAVEFPDAMPGQMTAAIRARLHAFRKHRQRRSGSAAAPAAPSASLPEQLERLIELRDHGELTPKEYKSAKRSLLTTSK